MTTMIAVSETSPLPPGYTYEPISPGRIPRSPLDVVAQVKIQEEIAKAYKSAETLWDTSNFCIQGSLEVANRVKTYGPYINTECDPRQPTEAQERIQEWLTTTGFLPKPRPCELLEMPCVSESMMSIPPQTPSRKNWKRYIPNLRKSPRREATQTSHSAPSTPRGRRLSLASLKRWASLPRIDSLSTIHPKARSQSAPSTPTRGRSSRLSLASLRRWSSPSRTRTYPGPSTNSAAEFGSVAEMPATPTSWVGSDSDITAYDECEDDPDMEETESVGSDESDESDDTMLNSPMPLFAYSGFSDNSLKLQQFDEADEIDYFFNSPPEAVAQGGDPHLEMSGSKKALDDKCLSVELPCLQPARLVVYPHILPDLDNVEITKGDGIQQFVPCPIVEDVTQLPWPAHADSHIASRLSQTLPTTISPVLTLAPQRTIPTFITDHAKWYNLLFFLLVWTIIFFISSGTLLLSLLSGIPLRFEAEDLIDCIPSVSKSWCGAIIFACFFAYVHS